MIRTMSSRRLALAVLALASATPLLSTTPSSAAQRSPSVALVRSYGVHHSSPVIEDVNGNGIDDVVFGGLDGKVHIANENGASLPGWPRGVIPVGSSTSVAIESSPTVADLDKDGKNEVIVGAGSLVKKNQHGGLVVFRRDGSVRCRVGTMDVYNQWTGGPPDRYREAVFSTPAVGDVSGDGYPDIVFGSWDHRLYAVNRNCQRIPGFPLDLWDTITSSPALFDVDGDGRQEIFIGSDATPKGGYFWAVEYAGGTSRVMWRRTRDEIVQSSPAIANIDGDARMEIVVGAGVYYQTAASNKVFAFNAENGTDVVGWPRSLGGNTFASPAVGDLNNDGKREIVIATRDGRVQALRGNGTLLWRVMPGGTGEFVGSPIISDLNGDGDSDVAVGHGGNTYYLDGRTGARQAEFGGGYAYFNSPAIAKWGSDRYLVVVGAKADLSGSFIGYYPLPSSPKGSPWAQFRREAQHRGR